MNITKIICYALCVLIICTVLKKFNKDYAILTICFTNTAICVFSFMILSPAFEYIKELTETQGLYDICKVMFKGCGVCLITSIASEICKDMGESGLSTKIEFAGKCTLIAFCSPLIKQVFEYAKMFIN